MVPVPEKQGVPLQTMVAIIHGHEQADINNRPCLAVIISRPDQIPRRRYTVASLVTRIRYRGNWSCNRSRVDGDKRTEAHGAAKIPPGCVGRSDRSALRQIVGNCSNYRVAHAKLMQAIGSP